MRVLWLFPAACLLSLVSCTPLSEPPVDPARPELVMYEWFDDGGPGEVAIRIDLGEQKAYYSRGGRPIGWSYVATGLPGHSTPAGSFRITEKVVDKYSNAYGWIEDEFGNVINGDAKPSTPVPAGGVYIPAPMPYWMRLTDYGIGMHAGLIPNPGQPASHGCIRLPKPLAPKVHDAVKIGTPVRIER
jgi:lipoprotein-anchoring transpeptidase ErfK/SrfK